MIGYDGQQREGLGQDANRSWCEPLGDRSNVRRKVKIFTRPRSDRWGQVRITRSLRTPWGQVKCRQCIKSLGRQVVRDRSNVTAIIAGLAIHIICVPEGREIERDEKGPGFEV